MPDERFSSPDTRWKEAHLEIHRVLDEKIHKLEWRSDAFNDRLNMGSSTFAEMKHELDQLKPKPIHAWKIISTIIGVALVIAGFIWQAARYPDRTEYNANVYRTNQENITMQREIQDLKEQQIQQVSDVKTTREAINRIEQKQDKIEDKLDNVLRRRHTTP